MLFASRGRKVGPAIFDRRYARLTSGMIGYWSPALTGPTGLQLLDLSGFNSHGVLTNMDAPTDWVFSPYGSVLDFDGSNDHVPLTRSNLISLAPIRACALIWVNPRQSAPRNTYLADWDTGGSNESLRLEMSGFNMTSGRIGGAVLTTGGTGTPVQTSATVTLNQWHCIAIQRTRAGQELYWNGVLNASNTSPIASAAANNPIVLGRAGSFNAFYANIQVAAIAIWNRDLLPSEHAEIFRLGPSGLGHPGRISLGIFEATIGYTMLADSRSYALSGLPIPLLYGRSIAADAASILLQGQTTPLRLSRLLSADPRFYQFSGVDAGILLGRMLDAGAAAYTVDGTSAGFLASRRISAELVAYLASGQDAAFLRSRVIQAGTGQYILIASPIDIQTGTGGAAPYYYLFLLGGSR